MRKLSPELDRAFDVAISIAYSLAIVTTFVRLYRRQNVGRIWWDDRFAFFSVLGSIWLLVLYWMKAAPPQSITATLSHRKARFWMGMLVLRVTLWFGRISLAFGTARIFPPQHLAYRLGIASVTVFACFLVAVVITLTVQCAPSSSWDPPHGAPPIRVICFIPNSGIYFSVVAGLIAEAFLIAIPVSALWNLKAPKIFRRMLLSAFAASVIVTPTTIALVVWQAAPLSWEPMRSETRVRVKYLEVAISGIVCNLIVIVSYAFRLVHGPSMRKVETPAALTSTKSYALRSRLSSQSLQRTTINGHSSSSSSSSSENPQSFTDLGSSMDLTQESHPGVTYRINLWSSYDPDTMNSISR